MKTSYNLIAFLLFLSLSVRAQNFKDSSIRKTSERKEINATNRLKKEIEQKQLSAPAVRIIDTTSAVANINKKKHKTCKLHKTHKSNK